MPDTRSPIERLGSKVIVTLSEWFKAVAQWVLDILSWPILQVTEAISDYLFDKLQVGSVPGEHAMLSLGAEGGLLEYLSSDMAKTSGIGRLIVGLMLAAGTIMGFIRVALEVGSRRMIYYINRLFRNKYITADEAVIAYIRGVISGSEMISLGEMDGFGASQMEVKEALMTQIPNWGYLRELYLREKISRPEVVRQLHFQGFSSQYAELLPDLFEVIPGAQDLIGMAVREAFSPEVAARFGQYEDFPPAFGSWAKKQGLSQEWAERYWAAHWSLPSASQGFEMLHRGACTQSDLEMLLRAQDVMPFWRDKIIKISYSPFTRVDIRRMYNLGILSYDEVKTAYRDIGYAPEKANKLAQFTASLQIQDDAELTKADVLDGYGRRLLDGNEATDYLTMMGFDATSIGFYLARVDMKVEADKKKQVLDNIQARFEKGIIEENEARRRLAEINILDTEINELITTWHGTRGQAVFTPTLADLKSFFKADIITEGEFREQLTNMGCSGTYQEWYIASMAKGKETT